MMIYIDDLRVYKSCGNVFSTKARKTNILECPQYKQSNLDKIKVDYEELTQD